MEQVTGRCVAVAAALAASALVVATPAVKSGLPDVQVRDADLAAEVSDLHQSQIGAFYDLVQQELAGTDLAQHDVDPGTGLFGGDGGAFNSIDTPTLNTDDTMLDQNLLGSLFGGGSVADALGDGAISGVPPIDAGGILPGAEFGSGAQGASAAASTAAVALADVIPALPVAYQAFTDGVVTAELALNGYLVSAQEAAVDRVFGAGSTNSDLANFMFSLNNMGLAHSEGALNSLLGANFDSDTIQNSLLTDFNPDGLSQAQWATMLGLTPGDFTALAAAAESGELTSFLSDVFPNLF